VLIQCMKTGVIRFSFALEIFFHFRRNGFIEHFVDVCARFLESMTSLRQV